MSDASTSPTHNLCIVRKETEKGKGFFQKVGAGWQTRSGKGINIRLDDGVVLDWRMMETHDIFIFPNWKDEPGGYRPGEGERQAAREAHQDAKREDLPFRGGEP